MNTSSNYRGRSQKGEFIESYECSINSTLKKKKKLEATFEKKLVRATCSQLISNLSEIKPSNILYT